MEAEEPVSGRDAAGGLAEFIHDFIEQYLAVPENNNLGAGTHRQAWGGFLLGFSSGANDLYEFYKKHIGEFHWTPAEAFALGTADAASPQTAAPDELTVVSFAVFPTEETKAANRLETRWPSEPWARTRIYGQRCLRQLQRALVTALKDKGYDAVAPVLLPQAREYRSRRFGDAWNWSERHAAYASGLGTFSLAGGLITERGQAHRLASVIVRAKIPSTEVPYTEPFEYCLYFTTGECVDCVDRCPVGSISPGGRNKRACAEHLDPATGDYVKATYAFDGYGCGLCQTGVPCESRIPAREPGRP